MFRKEPLSTSALFSKRTNCEQLVQCIYGLNYLEFQIFCMLQLHGSGDTDMLMEKLKRKERTKINRALSKLLDIGLVSREKVTGDRPGYRYVYYPKPLAELQTELKMKIDQWYANAMHEIEDLEGHLEEKIQEYYSDDTEET